ncbi:MAG: MBOAT family O-acyltransferase [Chitinophagaceae bacterium]
MLFNSIQFAVFLPIVFFLYWFVTRRKLAWQNALLLVSSYYFYACWDWRFLFLLLFSTWLDFYSGLKIHDATTLKQRRIWLWLSIGINAGFLGVFKYYNFFAQSFAEGLQGLGIETHPSTLNLILPVGISFYTFHGLSYVIDIFNRKIEPERNAVNYAVFVSFFPLLVAGPIERATHLLPQIKRERQFNYTKSVDGLRQILWGLFKKMVIADNCAALANPLFAHSEQYNGISLFLGALFFTFQIYCDFSGYSDIALGTARLFGIELLRNFAFPYFSRDMAEFWRRWHISLSSWFKDYLYIPLGGSRGGTGMRIRNTFIIFVVSGFWHGANWTFIVWGFLNALFIMPSIIRATNRNHLAIVAQGRLWPDVREWVGMLSTFVLTIFAWIFFRAESVQAALQYIAGIFKGSFYSSPQFPGLTEQGYWMAALIPALLVIEWLGREQQHALAGVAITWARPLRWMFYIALILGILFMSGEEQQFIYFQF